MENIIKFKKKNKLVQVPK